MQVQLTCEIEAGKLFFEYVHDVRIKSTWKQLTDTCVIAQPRALKTKQGLGIGDILKAGDNVLVKLGYNFANQQRFTGFVSRYTANTAVAEIHCEDEMWKLKQTVLNKSWKSTTVQEVVEYIKSETGSTWEYDILGDSVEIGAVKLEKISAAKVLEKLKTDFYQTCFFRKGKLIVGKPYEPEPTKRRKVVLEYGRNVIDWKGLEYKRRDELRINVTAISNMPDGKKKEVKVGDSDGEQRTLNFYNLSEQALKQQAEALLERLKYEGFRGKVPLFGQPMVEHGDVVVIKNERYPNKEGEYFIDAVDIEFNTKYRQVVELGLKL